MRRAFMLAELGAVLGTIVFLAAIFVLTAANHRRLGRLSDDLVHLKDIGTGSGQFGADNADSYWQYTWRRGQVYQTQYPDLNNAPDDIQAVANQMVYIIRTRGQRPDMPVIPAFIPFINYSPLPLIDYLDQKLPWLPAVSSGDRERLKWAADPACFDLGCFLPCQPSPSAAINRRWPYSSSYSVPFASFDLSAVGSRMTFSGSSTLIYSTTVFGARRFAEVLYPSQNVLLHDRSAWHFGARHCTHQEARLPLLMVDGSVPVRSAADANAGWQPNLPASPAPTTYSYQSSPLSCWDPPAVSPTGTDQVIGRFRFTRNGVAGRDFGGPEVQ